jgi:hypothetical protein
VIKALVCGGRDFKDRPFVINVLTNLNPDIVIQGGAEGADLIAKEWAMANFKPVWTFPADWDEHGKAAGPIRNQQMIDWGKPDFVIAFPGGKGTADMVRRANTAGLDVLTYSPADGEAKP